MNEMNEIKLPKGVDRIAVKQHDDRVVIEFIPEKRKFKAGDKVKIKDGISSETHRYVSPNFTEPMDEFIGKELIVKEYSNSGFVVLFGDYFEYHFNENWLELLSDKKEELKDGDLAIFWDRNPCYALVRVFERKGDYCYIDECGTPWVNAIKFECKDQFEKVLRGEIN